MQTKNTGMDAFSWEIRPSMRALRNALVGWMLALGWLTAGWAAEPAWRISPKEMRDDVHAVVDAQLTALRSGDFAAAYALAARGIQRRFDERLFAAMMRRGYAPLLRASEADIGVVRDLRGEQAQVTVAVVDGRKENIVYRYWLVREDGKWRVNGVTAESAPAQGDV
jgi:ABC-type transporter MlaC component